MERQDYIIGYINGQMTDMPAYYNTKLTKSNQKFNHRLEFNQIKENIDKYIDNKSSNRFFVLPGLRGVGKTTLLFQAYDYLLNEKNIDPNSIIYISFDELSDIVECSIREAVEIFLKNRYNTNLRLLDKNIFLLVDECQYDDNWAKSGKIIYDKSDNVFMIFSGSSALQLEYGTDATRRVLKQSVFPLNYAQHLKLRYNISLEEMSKSLEEMLLTGKVENAIENEIKVNQILVDSRGYVSTDWDEYLKYGGFPILFEEDSHRNMCFKLVDIMKKVINSDMLKIKNFTVENQANAMRILNFLATQKPGEASQQKLSNHLRTSASNVKNILDVLEKTKLIFHCEPYGESSKRIKKSWKYYFATSSLRHALSLKIGTSMPPSEYEGVLLENMVAMNLFNLSNSEHTYFNLFTQTNKKNAVFLIRRGLDEIIPIEVGLGDKNKCQVKSAMNKYNSNYGIVVSSTSDCIEKDGDVIFVPLKTFSFL